MKGKKPQFLCESCGAEVPLEAKHCPGCGRLFEAVRCPACGFTGDDAAFLKGCPACGAEVPAAGGTAADGPATVKNPVSISQWVYLVGAAILAGVFALLLFRFV
jgi:ssDNA-binding Zn-finger/Zn-ribbon topoisomerase 1